jgi:bifunctional non-homologous end joining protein LigD
MANQTMPALIPPMLAKTGAMPADDSGWSFEIKWDGIRAIAYIDRGQFRLLSRNHKDITAQYPEVTGLGETLASRRIILDGELVALDAHGRPSFANLQHRMGLSAAKTVARVRQTVPVTYIIFDLLYLDGRELLDKPYLERRRLLAELALGGPAWQTPAHKEGQGQALQAATMTIGLEGVIAKRSDSLYEAGQRSGAWLKVKNVRRQELVIAGWVPGAGRRQGGIGALLVGYYDRRAAVGSREKPRLVYAGKVGTGFSDRQLTELGQLLAPLRRPASPFDLGSPAKGAIFTAPVLVGEFTFTEWTPHGTLRHPSFKGLRPDKAATDVVREPTPIQEG